MAVAGQKFPDDWIACDGRELDSRDRRYKALYNAIGTTYGGDGNPMFKVPNYNNGRFLRGGSQAQVGANAGSETHSHKVFKDGGRDGRGFNVDGTCGLGDAVGANHLPPYFTVQYVIKL